MKEVGLVRNEQVVVIGPKPNGWNGLGHKNGDTLVRYPDGEVGAVRAVDIQPGEKAPEDIR